MRSFNNLERDLGRTAWFVLYNRIPPLDQVRAPALAALGRLRKRIDDLIFDAANGCRAACRGKPVHF
jgi:hypothetical protein